MSKVIGGEFEINPALLKHKKELNEDSGYYYSSGRAALYYILENITQTQPQIDTILLPDYLCESIIKTVSYKNLKIKYYELTDQLTLDKNNFSKVYSGGEIVLVINYFGLANTGTQIDYIRSLDSQSCIILDNVQAFYEMTNQTKANYSFTSFRKWFPVPDGALVKTKEQGMFFPKIENVFSKYKIAGSFLKKFRDDNVNFDGVYLSLFDKGENLIFSDLASKISITSKTIFSKLDLSSIAWHRKENAKFIIEELACLGIKPIIDFNEEKVPLFIPIKISGRNMIRSRLAEKGIYCPIHWSTNSDTLSKGKEMAKNELSIVIDQRYNKQDMIRIISIIKQCLSA